MLIPGLDDTLSLCTSLDGTLQFCKVPKALEGMIQASNTYRVYSIVSLGLLSFFLDLLWALLSKSQISASRNTLENWYLPAKNVILFFQTS